MRARTRVAVVGNGGGQAAVAGAGVLASGLAVARLDDGTSEMIRVLAGCAEQVRNPVDLGAETAAAEFARVLHVVAADPGVDALLVTHLAVPWLDQATFVGVLRSVGDPLVAKHAVAVVPAGWGAPVVACPRGEIPVFGSVEGAADALYRRLAGASQRSVAAPVAGAAPAVGR